MPRIDPQQLLRTLGILLSPSGGIKSSEEVDRLVKLMSKFSRKLVSKCIYVQILKATPADLLSKFLAEGGWQLLNTWFDDAIKAHNWPLVREMLHLFQFCPMTAELLKENANEHQAPKLINQLRQEVSIQADIRGLALDIYKSWVAVVSSTPTIKIIEQNHQNTNYLPDHILDDDSSDDSNDDNAIATPNAGASDEASGPVSLLQSLADEVSESLKKETTSDPEISALKNRKVPTVIKPTSKIIDATIKINKKNLPPSDTKKSSSKKSSSVSDEQSSKPEKRRRSSESLPKSPSASKAAERSGKRFRPDGIRDEVNPEEKQRIKDMARKMKEEAQAKKTSAGGITSTLGKIPRIPKKTPSTSSMSSPGPASNSTAESDKRSKSFEEMLGGLDSKPKTVKTPMIKNKTAALLEGMQKSSSEKSSSKSSSSSSSKSSSSSSHKKDHHHHSSSSKKDHHRDRDRDSNHHRDSKRDSGSSSSSKSERKLSLTMPSSEVGTPPPSSSKSKSKNSDSESPKVAKSPSSAAYQESNSFMDAIFSSMGVPSRKKKRRNSESKDPDSAESKSEKIGKSGQTPPKVPKKDSESPSTVEPKKEPAQPTFSFYQDTQDTLETKEKPTETETKMEIDAEIEADQDAKPKIENGSENHDNANNAGASDEISNGKEMSDALPFEEPESMPREVKGILVYHRGRGKRDKKITWRPEASLVEVEYFEVDENERVNVNKLKFDNLREMESKMEKVAMNSKTNFNDDETPLLNWYKPRPIKVENREPFTAGANSKEKETQSQREKNVLQVIYFSRAMTPDTPSEAEPERDTTVMRNTQPSLIPTEDNEADDNSEFQYASKGWPDPKQNEVSKQASLEAAFSLPPALSTLLSSIHKGGLGAIIPPPSIQKTLNTEEQEMLAAQMEAVKKLSQIGVGAPALNEPPPNLPPGFNERLPPPGIPPFGAPPPFGGPPPQRQNGYSQGPPPGPPPSFGGFQNRNGRGGGSGGYQGGNHQGGYQGGNNQGGYRTGGGGQRGGHFRDNNFRDNRDNKQNWNNHRGPNNYRKGTCRFFVEKGSCRDGDNCRYVHDQQSNRN